MTIPERKQTEADLNAECYWLDSNFSFDLRELVKAEIILNFEEDLFFRQFFSWPLSGLFAGKSN